MALWRGIGARKDSTRGTTPIEVRKTLSGLFIPVGGIGARSGILLGAASPLVTGNATWAYNVGTFHAYVSRSAADGGQVYGNDASALIGATGVGTTVPIAPAAGLQRIDIIWTRHPTNTENADTASEPLFGVASGTAAATAVAPSIPTGAIELGRNLMTDAATSTVSAGNTITQTALYTALRGAPVPVRNATERDALTLYDGLQAYRLDTHVVEAYNGTAWGPLASPGALIPVGTATASGDTTKQITACFSATYRHYVVKFSLTNSANALQLVRLGVGGTPDANANYNSATEYLQLNAAANGVANVSASTSWQITGAGGTVRTEGEIHLYNPNVAVVTTGWSQAIASEGATLTGAHLHRGGQFYNGATQFTDIQFLQNTGTITGTITVYGIANS